MYIFIFMASNLESNTWTSIITYGKALQIYLSESISPYGLSLITKTTHGGTMHFQPGSRRAAAKDGGDGDLATSPRGRRAAASEVAASEGVGGIGPGEGGHYLALLTISLIHAGGEGNSGSWSRRWGHPVGRHRHKTTIMSRAALIPRVCLAGVAGSGELLGEILGQLGRPRHRRRL